jgi:hypothetical protein
MRIGNVLVAMAIAFGSSAAYADLEIYKDYTVSDAVWVVTTVKVKPNMVDAYLEGLKETWVAGNEVAKSLGQMEDYAIYVSELPGSGDFNLVLTAKFKNDEMLAPNKERYDAFVAKFGAERQKQTTEKAQRDYPAMREITGDYRLRQITLK